MVWSDAEIAKLSREFVTVADEVYKLYPEDEWNLKRVQDKPAHKFFKRYGEAMPDGDWNRGGTKQGLYMMGPDGEYLEGKFAANGFPDDIKKRMRRALTRWEELRVKKGYDNKPVPRVVTTLPARVDGKEFVLRVHSRDLPRADGPQDTRRFDPNADLKNGWSDFKKWAWNENWLAVDKWRVLVPKGPQVQDVDAEFVMRLAREMLIDNVRGQAGVWPEKAIKKAKLTMQGARSYGGTKITYRGEVALDDGTRSMTLKLFGDADYDNNQGSFRTLRIVAVGMRKGAHRFNQREDDWGPAPIGFAINLWRTPAQVADDEGRLPGMAKPSGVRPVAGPSARASAPDFPHREWFEWWAPAAADVDPEPLAELANAIGRGRYGYINRLLVARRGGVLLDQRWQWDYLAATRGRSMDIGWGAGGKRREMAVDYNYLDLTRHPFRDGSELHSLQSVTKSVMSLLVGIALQKGHLKDLEQPIEPMLKPFASGALDARFANARLVDLLTMRTGIEWHEWGVRPGQLNTTLALESSDDWLRFIMRQPMDAAPGTKWNYNSGSSHLLSAILHQATGMHVDSYAEKHLFAPIGIRSHHWKKDPQGYPDGEGGLYLRAEDLLRIGHLVLRDGNWWTRRLVPGGWIGKSTDRLVDVPGGRSYGYQWWRVDHQETKAIAALGFGGQMLLIVPDHEFVAVVNGWNVFEEKHQSLTKDLVPLLIRSLRLE